MPATATNKRRTPQGDFSKRVKKRLVELELSVTDVANAIGVNRNTVSRAIHHDLFQPTRVKISNHLKISL